MLYVLVNLYSIVCFEQLDDNIPALPPQGSEEREREYTYPILISQLLNRKSNYSSTHAHHAMGLLHCIISIQLSSFVTFDLIEGCRKIVHASNPHLSTGYRVRYQTKPKLSSEGQEQLQTLLMIYPRTREESFTWKPTCFTITASAIAVWRPKRTGIAWIVFA